MSNGSIFMSAIVFLGPTLSVADASSYLSATFMPPAAQGDVFRAARRKPRAIGIIDGYFERVAAVWHKEILWALSRGIYVFGSASMGALRAVELAPFGMIGVGEVFAAFHRNELEDDDEVAILHGPPESEYRPLSEAMVNVRATLEAAVDAGVVSRSTETTLREIAKALPYGSRTYRAILLRARERGIDEAALDSLRQWLPHGAVNRKRLDAIGMLRAMRHLLATTSGPYTPKFRFEYTEQWEAARTDALSRDSGCVEGATSDLLQEVQLTGQLPALRRSALARLLACDRPEHDGVQSDPVAVGREVTRFRFERGLVTDTQFDDWRASQALTDPQELVRLFAGQSAVSTAELRYEPELQAGISDELRLRGDFAALQARAHRKRQVLAQHCSNGVSLSDVNITEADLWQWYFGEILGIDMPEHLDAYARTHAFRELPELREAVLREYIFRRLDAHAAPDLQPLGEPSESRSGRDRDASDGSSCVVR